MERRRGVGGRNWLFQMLQHCFPTLARAAFASPVDRAFSALCRGRGQSNRPAQPRPWPRGSPSRISTDSQRKVTWQEAIQNSPCGAPRRPSRAWQCPRQSPSCGSSPPGLRRSGIVIGKQPLCSHLGQVVSGTRQLLATGAMVVSLRILSNTQNERTTKRPSEALPGD